MDEKIINLSGVLGLADGFAGDIDTVTVKPQYITNAKDGELATGMFNPYIREGHLFPVSNSKTTVTTSDAISSRISSTVVDISDGVVWAADPSGQVFKLDNLTDTSLNLTQTLYSNSTTVSHNDLELYQINGVKRLFSTSVKTFGVGISDYRGIVETLTPTNLGTTIGTTFSSFDGVTTPGIYNTSIKSTIGPTTTLSKSIVIDAAKSNQLIYVVVVSPNDTGTVTATYGGNPMTSYGSGNSSTSGYYDIFVYLTPPTGSNTIAITTSNSVADLMFSVETIYDTSGTISSSSSYTSSTSTVASVSPNISTSASLYTQFVVTDALTIANKSEQQSNYSRTITGTATTYEGRIDTFDLSQKILQVAVMDSAGAIVESDWLYQYTSVNTDNPIGGFVKVMNSDWSFIKNSGNGFSYLFAENAVHKIDGTTTGGSTGALTKNVLLFPDTFRLVDAVDFNSRMYIGVHEYSSDATAVTNDNFVGECGILVWNRISTQFNSTNYVRLPGVKEIKKIYASPDGVIKLIIISNSGLTQLRQFGYNDSGGVVFPVVKTMGVGAFPQLPDSVSNYGDKTAWIANDGNLYVERKNAVTKLFNFKTEATTSSGMTSNIISGALTFASGVETADAGYRSNKQGLITSFNDGSARVYKIYPLDLKDGSNAAQTPNIGNVYTGVSYLPLTGEVERIRIYSIPTTTAGTTAAATVKLYFNQSSTPNMTKTVSKSEATRGYVDFNISTPYLHAIQVEVEWDTSITLGDDTYAPSVAVISYKKTTVVSPDNG